MDSIHNAEINSSGKKRKKKKKNKKLVVFERFLRVKYKILNILYGNMYKKSLGFWKDKQYSYVEPFLLAQPFRIQQFLFLTRNLQSKTPRT